jgi:hypothetical protein
MYTSKFGFLGFWQGEGDLAWPEIATTAVEVASALERLSHDSLGNDLHKYNLKMRQLDFNVKVISHSYLYNSPALSSM